MGCYDTDDDVSDVFMFQDQQGFWEYAAWVNGEHSHNGKLNTKNKKKALKSASKLFDSARIFDSSEFYSENE